MFKKTFICYIEIFILVVAIFAFAYLIHDIDRKKGSAVERDFSIGKWITLGISGIAALMMGLLVFFFIIYNTEEVSANLASTPICCSKTNSGKWCEMDLPQNCDKNFPTYMSNCSEVNEGYCQKGCCQSQLDGICNPQTSNASCKDLGGEFFPGDSLCGGVSCRIGCCQLGGSDAKLTTEKQCRFLGNSQNPTIPTEWKPEITNQLKCKYSVQGATKGACIFENAKNRSCVYTTLDDCIARTGSETNFDVTGVFCSDPSLNTTCKAHAHKGCVENKDDVFWFDSCENPEDVAKDCDLFTGTYCGKDNLGAYICKDINCVINGKSRKNGESWCEYDNVIGKGKDPAGSRHIRHVCYFGTERIEPCADYRNQICVESTSTTTEGASFSQAACRVNNWRRCLELNAKKSVDEMKNLCNKNPDCWVKHIDMAGSFKFDVCVPQYPPGFDLYDENDDLAISSSGDAICSIATQRCTETWICGIFGCICVDNCKCSTSYFTEEMNELCISLGDCGAWINYVDVWTNGGISTRSTGQGSPGTLNGGNTALYKQRAGPKPAKPGSFEFFEGIKAEKLRSLDSFNQDKPNSALIQSLNENLSSIKKKLNAATKNLEKARLSNDAAGISKWNEEVNRLNGDYLDTIQRLDKAQSNQNTSAFEAEIEKIAGSMGSPLLLYMVSHDSANSSNLDEFQLNNINANPTTAGSFFNSFSSARSAISAQIVQKDIKAGGMEMIAALIAGLIAYLIFESILIAFMAALLAYLMFLAWIMYVYVDFSCGMWERPSGNKNCNKCNTPDIPCTEYRCESLGELCKFINKGTTSELCLAMPANSTLPVIQPLLNVITLGYKYESISENGFDVRKENGKCVDPFNTIHIGIKIDPFAKCRFDTDPKKKWEEMTYEFGFKGKHILPSHQLDLFFPSPEAIKRSFAGEMICNTTENPCKEQYVLGKKEMVCPKCNLTDEQIEKLTKTEIFVKCKTADGKQNPEPYHINTCVNPGPDLTPPVIRIITPGTGGYVKYGENNQSIVVYVDEPSQCRWTTRGPSITFDQMENQMDCRINVGSDYSTLLTPGGINNTVKVEYGLPCFGTLNVTENEKFWIRCQDLSENKNNMAYSFVYEIKKSESPLKISDMRPIYGSEIISPVDPTSILFRVETIGGAKEGDSKCKYYDSDVDLYYYISDIFKEDYTNIHEIPWTNAPRGDWNITFECWDVAGNLAKNNTFFTIKIDDQGPKITRVFNYGGLRVSTSEPAECRYSTKKNFAFENATEMNSANKIEHSGQWNFHVIYYVECRDEYGNPGPRIIVSPFEQFSFY